jgi:hypothetical protein
VKRLKGPLTYSITPGNHITPWFFRCLILMPQRPPSQSSSRAGQRPRSQPRVMTAQGNDRPRYDFCETSSSRWGQICLQNWRTDRTFHAAWESSDRHIRVPPTTTLFTPVARRLPGPNGDAAPVAACMMSIFQTTADPLFGLLGRAPPTESTRNLEK